MCVLIHCTIYLKVNVKYSHLFITMASNMITKWVSLRGRTWKPARVTLLNRYYIIKKSKILLNMTPDENLMIFFIELPLEITCTLIYIITFMLSTILGILCGLWKYLWCSQEQHSVLKVCQVLLNLVIHTNQKYKMFRWTWLEFTTQ